ncbi:potassium transporter TrkG [Leptospira sp. GIMC2001]|uniref:potassium transporter TrkG n=1 Tax=Leptospira sp. GIMC2001 TaxID=1513297 RepID=UPI002349250C|nr:potassium transporter TrkG [Leptospira sp. GIMC2001]WCL50552.1 potassium transporter Trk [Leptospira sp. GIMC2001]
MRFIQELFSQLSVARVVVIGFMLAISLGSLAIFISERGALSYVDSFYLSASAVCITGLSPIPLSELEKSTQAILLFLIQLGGLGIISFTVLIGVLILKGMSRNTKFNMFVKEAIDSPEDNKIESVYSSKEVNRVLLSIINISFTIEAIGTILIYYTFPEDIPADTDRLFLSLFTSISAFNNAGFSILDDLSIITYDPRSIYIVSSLAILGGIGFPVIIYIEKIFLEALHRGLFYLESLLETHYYSYILNHPEKTEYPSLYPFILKISHMVDERLDTYNMHLHGESNRIQTKLLFYGTLILLLLGTVFVYALESSNPHTLYGMDASVKIANSFFISVCSRTSGFNTFDLTGINDATIVMICILMFIGGGPQGTAGGVKITTFAILVVYLKNVINPSKTVQIFGETVSKNSVAISIRVYFLATSAIAVIFIILTLLNRNEHSLHVVFFEMMSAFSTVGFSLGLTPTLGDIEKLFYCLIMFVGRIGVFTVLIAMTGHAGVPKMGDDDESVKIQVG